MTGFFHRKGPVICVVESQKRPVVYVVESRERALAHKLRELFFLLSVCASEEVQGVGCGESVWHREQGKVGNVPNRVGGILRQ